MKPYFDEQKKLIHGKVIIDRIGHRIYNYKVVCGLDLTDEAPNTTRLKSDCLICFPRKEKPKDISERQLELF